MKGGGSLGMERSDSIIKFVAVLVFTAVMAYLGVSFVAGYRNPLRTVNASGMELRDGLETTGYLVRDEELLTASGSNIAVTVTEGAKLASGETVAVRYSGSTAMERAGQISEIQMKIRQLNAIKNGKSEDELSKETVISLSKAVSSGDLSQLYELEQDVDAYIISGTALATGNEDVEIAALEDQLRGLSQSASSDTGRVAAPFSGTFSFVTDGFEGVKPSDMEGLTVSQYEALFASAKTVPSGTVGKMVRGIKWYYATEVDEENARKLTVGNSVTLVFSRNYSAELKMKVESVSLPEDGRCAVVFSSDRYMQDVAAVREVSAEIVFETQSGIAVPKEAVHLNEEGETVCYVLEGITAHETGVRILAESGDYYMAEETHDGLREGDIIIVRAANLYDNAVVEE